MSPRITLILAVVVAALGAFVWFYEVEGSDRRAEAEASEKRLFADLEGSDLEAIDLTTTDGIAARLERREGVWQLVAPLAFPADAATAQALASAVAALETDSVFTDPEPLANYGLGGEALVRGIAAGREVAIVLGNETPTGSRTYVAPEGDARVFTVASHRTNALKKSLQELRDPRVLELDPEAAREIEVRWVGGSVIARKVDDAWRLVHPLEVEADAEAIESLLSDLGFLRAEGFVDEPDASTLASLDDPSLRFLVRGEAGAELSDLAVGPPTEGARRVVRGRAGLYELAEARLDGLPRTVVALRAKQITSFAMADARAFELQFHDDTAPVLIAGVVGEDGAWTATPEGLAPGKVSRLLSELSDLEALDIAAEGMGADELVGVGLSPPGAVLRVFGDGAPDVRTRLAEVSLGRHDVGRGVAAQRRDDPVVYWLPESLVEHLPLDLAAFRADFVATEPAPATTAAGSDSGEPDNSDDSASSVLSPDPLDLGDAVGGVSEEP